MNYIFDLDKTLTNYSSVSPLPGVICTLDKLRLEKMAIVTNQGGPAYREWLSEFAEEEAYANHPTFAQVHARMMKISDLFCMPIYVCLAYTSRKGYIAPAHHEWTLGNNTGLMDGIFYSWEDADRKPNVGLLRKACDDLHIPSSKVTFVGDSDTDERAAQKAMIRFVYAKDFF